MEVMVQKHDKLFAICLLKYQVPFSALPPAQEDARYRERALRNLQRKALKLGARIVIDSPSDTQAHGLGS